MSGQYRFKVCGGEAQHLQGSNCRGGQVIPWGFPGMHRIRGRSSYSPTAREQRCCSQSRRDCRATCTMTSSARACARYGVLVVGEEMKGLVNCNFLPGSARRLELGTVSAEPLSRASWSQNSGRSAKRLACRARVLLATDSAQAGRGPQWPIHRISAPANDAVRLPGARRLERQMTVTDGRAEHFRTVSAVVRVRPGAVRQAVGHRPGDRGRAHGGQSAARSYSPGRLPPRRAGGAPPPSLRLRIPFEAWRRWHHSNH